MKNSLLAVTYAQLAIERVNVARRIAMQHTPAPGTTDNDLTASAAPKPKRDEDRI